MTQHETEVFVVGAGPGGYVAAIRAGQLGLDVTLVDKAHWGGACLNHGCIPSKALITAADLAHDAAHAEEMGVDAEISVDLGRMVAWKDRIVDRLTTGVERLNKASGVTLLEGTATFLDERTAEVRGAEDTTTVAFEHAILATGSRPIELPGFAFEDAPVLDSRQALGLESVPESLVIVGAGYIGMELATVFAKLGCAVTVVEMLESAIPMCADDLTRPVTKRATDLGIDLHFGEGATGWEPNDDGIVVRTETDDGTAHEYPADRVLVAVGRRPVVESIGLEALGLEVGGDGFVETDHRRRTDVEAVYAVGDVAGEPLLAHKASAEGLVAAEAIAGREVAFEPRAIPAVIFTDPEIGMVGMTEATARESGIEPVVGEFPFMASGRALTTGRTEGFVRIVAEAGTDRILGAEIVGPEASELIAELGLAVENELTLEQVGSTIHAHPTLSEAVMEAADHALGRAIHTLNR